MRLRGWLIREPMKARPSRIILHFIISKGVGDGPTSLKRGEGPLAVVMDDIDKFPFSLGLSQRRIYYLLEGSLVFHDTSQRVTQRRINRQYIFSIDASIEKINHLMFKSVAAEAIV
ncbi:hypothetical protein M413DRAFT_245932 [Hebeloma cylindrosporum]|uniref:Uncharacterized protein n=1 Tax=Hebeloma cylindrosporum TaxID=76867 RepID=A0A0C3BP13_HEBCY|nr:hypothetical protein M413DRAFT_245932 [Hebeloma cylindrosporum h7]